MNAMIYNNRDKRNKIISFAVCGQVTLIGIKNMLVHALPIVYEKNEILNIILLLIVACVYLYTIGTDRQALKINKKIFGIVAFIFASFVFTIVFFNENVPYIVGYLPRIIPYCFLTWYLITKLTSLQWIEWYMKRFSLIIICVAVMAAFFIFRQGHITTSVNVTYSMSLSYVAMVGVMWYLKEYFETDKLRYFLIAGVGILVIIMYGARNPLLAIGSYLAISVPRKGLDKTKGKKRIKYWLLCIVGLTVVLFFERFLTIIGNILQSFGVFSRTVALLSSGTISTSGRDVIHSLLSSVLNQHPILGLGIFGDEVALSRLGMTQSAHSLYLSIFSSYGYFLGGAILIALIALCIKALKKANTHEREILLLYMCMVWPRGFTGGDIWGSDVFWWMFGLVLVVLINKKQVILDVQWTEKNFQGEDYDKNTTFDKWR